ncbi:FAD-dependent oxidoreductase [Arcanobacterium bovis]|uniref:Pyridine nucleotide-disulfide oxidoreductase n=1 Tax=Arcanobacterium bovis TaxID=2529275 RepID=A0A4Q9V0E5_9ACTO|nr:FAD-dependent oxidoreductase [Arcanobacterium bovis]TBW20906.1 pyridine nucleotide-disulfide oxidoreductase [Arcanobacterium bovis]
MNIVVIGGVAGGMSAAARIRRNDEDANIIVLEAGEYVSFANCGLPYHVGGDISSRDSLLLHTPESLHTRANLDVRIRHEVVHIDRAEKVLDVDTPEGRIQIQYDKLLLATGAKGVVPRIKGIDHQAVNTLRTIPEMDSLKEKISQARKRAEAEKRHARAVVIGGGFIGLEAVEALVQLGLDVTLADLAPHVLPPIDEDLAPYLAEELEKRGVKLKLGVAADEIRGEENGQATVVFNDGTESRADVVLLSVGVLPRSELARDAGLDLADNGAIVVDEFQLTSDANIWAVGDAATVTLGTGGQASAMLAGPANRQGRIAADSMCGVKTISRKPVLRTAVVRVFDQIAAVTGCRRRELDEADVKYVTVRLHAPHHVGYFPGAETIHMLGFFSEDDGALLGAQAVGKAGVDKRIDVLATAIRAGMTADDLAEVELTYSPPVGAAKDPVNMLGFVAQNHLSGYSKLIQPEDIPDARSQGIILDVRNPAEVANWALADSLKIPLGELRDRISQVRDASAGKPIYVHCASGIRSYLAVRILLGNGLEAYNIAGGEASLRIAQKLGKL